MVRPVIPQSALRLKNRKFPVTSLAAAAILAALAVFVPAASPFAAEAAPKVSPVPLLDPPVRDGQPVAVRVAVEVVNLASVDQVMERFEVSGYLIARWKDSRLKARADADPDGIVHLRTDEVWAPEFTMINSVEPRTRARVDITVNRKAEMTYLEFFHAKLSSRFHLSRLPFDTQILGIRIQPLLDEANVVALTIDGGDSGISFESRQYESVEEWRIGTFAGTVRQAHIANQTYVPEALFSLTVSRKYAFYVWKVFVPLVLMVLLSWAVFWVELADLANQVQIGVTTVLTVIAFGLAVSYTLPRIPYLTYTDAFFLQCYVFVFIAILELMAVHVTHKERQKADLGRRIRRNSRWAVPSAFVLSNISLVLYFLA